MKTLKTLKHIVLLIGMLLMSFAGEGQTTIKIDTLTRESIGVLSNSYNTWESNNYNSNITYKGYTAGGHNDYYEYGIQIRSNKKPHSGIVTTTENGIIYKIRIKWLEQNGIPRILRIYGKNTQYTSPDDLYANNFETSGNTIGELYYDRFQQDEELNLYELENTYSYIGIRSHNNAIYIDTIFIYWEIPIPLPISLLSFMASPQLEYNLVQWTTATEKNNDLFILERSEDAVVFDEVYNVSGAGNSLEPLDYEFRDYCPVPDITYYRLTQVDYDGSKTTSEMVSCIRTSEKMSNWEYFTRYDNLLQVHSSDKVLTIVCSDLLGRTIWQGKLLPHDDSELNLQTPYMVHIYEDNVLVGSEKVLW